jgi:hypothetical protein
MIQEFQSIFLLAPLATLLCNNLKTLKTDLFTHCRDKDQPLQALPRSDVLHVLILESPLRLEAVRFTNNLR